MLPLDYLHLLVLAAIALYIWQREPPRLLLTPLMLLSFLVLYGVGNVVYFAATDTVPAVHHAVTLSLILMWIGLVVGIESARVSAPVLVRQSARTIATWKITALHDVPRGDQLLAAAAVLCAAFILAVFVGLGKPSQIVSFLSIASAHEKLKYRLELGGEGGYLYQTLIASIAPFLSLLLLAKSMVSKRAYVLIPALVLCVAAFVGKLGTFEKIPWLIYVLQIVFLFQLRRRLEISVGRIIMFICLVLAGATVAALIAIPDLDAIGILSWLGYRFFEVNNEVIYQTFYVYPHYLPHTLGMNIALVHNLFGNGDMASAHTQVANFFGAEGATFDAFFVGDAWVDFSYVGVMALAIAVGFVVKMIDLYITALGKTPLALALLASSLYGLFQLQVTSAFTAFLSGGLLFIPLLVLTSQALMNDLTRGQLQWQR